MIQFHNVKKDYHNNDFILGDLSFHIAEGEFVFLIGPSGSGKTSVIKLLIREESPSTGKIYFDDYDITKLTRDSVYKLRRHIGVVFQDYKLIVDKTVAENVAFAMEVAGRGDREIQETVPYLLDIVGLSHRADAFPEYLSGGEKQRVAIARAVSNNPRVLIADEPTGNLDPAAAWDVVQILSKINNWGTTVVMSTHGTDIVNTLNKRVIQMENGQIVRDDNKGLYEVTGKRSSDEDSSNPLDKIQSEEIQASQGPIRVRIKSNAGQDNSQETQKNKGFFRKLWPFGSKSKRTVTPLEEEFGKEIDAEMAKKEFIQDVDVSLENAPQEEVAQVLRDADNVLVDSLNLRKEIIADLKTAGYKDVEDIITAGPEKLAEELVIDPEEVVLVARALAEFIASEDSKYKQQKKRALVQKYTKKASPAKSEKTRKSKKIPKSLEKLEETKKESEEVEIKSPPKASKKESVSKKSSKVSEVRVDLTSSKKIKKHAK